MSILAMNATEEKQIDSQIEQMMDWAKTRSAEAEQLALDSARLMASTTDRIDRLKNQNFFKRCWNRFTGQTGEMERANTSDIIQMQKKAFRYVNMLQEQQLLMAHSLLSLKNNLVSLAIKEEETRNLIDLLAKKTHDRFENLEKRVDQLEISTNLQGWLLGLEERDYDEKYPTEYMRLFRVINDFYQIKRDNWNYNDLMFMRKAIRTVGLNPKQKISLNAFINTLTDEIQNKEVGFDAFGEAITMFAPSAIENYSKFVLDSISSPIFVSIHGLKVQYMDRLDMVEELREEMNISAGEALKRLLLRSISNLNVNLNCEFPLADAAIEILSCVRLTSKLLENQYNFVDSINSDAISEEVIDVSEQSLFDALDDDDLEKVEYMLKHGVSANCVQDGETPLMRVASSFYVSCDAIDLLMNYGATIDIEDESKETALCKAISPFLREEYAIRLLNFGANINHIDSFGHTLLTDAAMMGCIDHAKFLIDNGADINQIDSNGNTPLGQAAMKGHIDLVKFFIENGADINQIDSNGNTPLGQAAMKGHIDLVKFFIENGADVNLSEEGSSRPLESAISCGNIETIELLLKAGATVENGNALTYLNKLKSFLKMDDDRYNALHEMLRKYDSESKEEAILTQFTGLMFDERSDLYIKGCANSTKARKKLITGLESFGMGTDEDEVVIYYDGTLMGGGEDGFILTADTIYFKESFSDPDYEKYESITKISQTSTGITIYMGERKADVFCGNDEIKECLYSAIKQVW